MDLVLNGMTELNEQELMMVDGGWVMAVVAVVAFVLIAKEAH